MTHTPTAKIGARSSFARGTLVRSRRLVHASMGVSRSWSQSGVARLGVARGVGASIDRVFAPQAAMSGSRFKALCSQGTDFD